MPVLSVGDMSQHFLSLKHTGSVKSDLAKLGQSLASGQVSDVTQHLSGQTQRLAGIDHSLSIVEAYQSVATETNARFDAMQMTLNRFETLNSSTADLLLQMQPETPDAQQRAASENAKQQFVDAIGALNLSIGGKIQFSGAETQTNATEPAETILDDIIAHIGSATDATSIRQAVQDWFNDPSGGFVTNNYLGATGDPVSRRIAPDTDVEFGLRADSPEIRSTLASMALGAIVGGLTSSIDRATSGQLLQDAGAGAIESGASIAKMQAQLGFQQERVASSMSHNAAEKAALATARNEAVEADPYETATRLQATQRQLEMQFTITARLANLSLASYI